MTMDIRRALLLPSLVAVAAIATACSSGGGAATAAAPSAAAPSAAASTEPSAAASESAAASPASAAGLALADSKFGKIIVAGNGMTLYMFTPDEDAGGKVTCYDQCAAAWPALMADDAAAVTAGAGLDASKITLVDRTDGGKQVKYGEYPLYFYAKDAAAGDVNGQGVGGKWYVVGADGEPIKS